MKVFIPPRNRRFGTVDILGLAGLVGLLVVAAAGLAVGAGAFRRRDLTT